MAQYSDKNKSIIMLIGHRLGLATSFTEAVFNNHPEITRYSSNPIAQAWLFCLGAMNSRPDTKIDDKLTCFVDTPDTPAPAVP